MDHDLQTLSMHDLVDRMHAEDPEAQNELIRRIGARMELLCRKMLARFARLRPFVGSDDVMQNACLRLLGRLKGYRPTNTREFFALASKEVRRELLDLAKYHDAGKRPPSDKVVPLQGSEDQSATPLQLSDAIDAPDELEHWTAFHEAVFQLPEKEREVFDLIWYHGCEKREVAKLLQRDEKTVRRRLRRACTQLKELLGGELPVL